MNDQEQVLTGFWELFQKKILLENHIQKDKLNNYTPSEIHCIQYIGNNPNSNVTKLANAFYMTTGGVTKLTQKLIKKNMIETYRSADNKKEVYFQLTEQGRKIYEIHEKLHKEFNERDEIIFNQITEEEYHFLIYFATIYNNHLDNELQKLGLDIKSGISDKL